MARNRILVIDDEATIRVGLREALEARGYQVQEAGSCVEGENQFRSHRPDAVISDYRLPDGNALELLPRLKAIEHEVPVILLTAHGSVDLAVQAIKDGAEHFLTKPVVVPALMVILERVLEHQRNRQTTRARRAGQHRVANPFTGNGTAMRELETLARRVATAERPILIQGETGTGKGVLARWLHANGPRAEESMVELNCANLPAELLESELFGHERGAFTGAVTTKTGLLELAHRGILFLDEIGDLDPGLQPKLLTVLEDQRYRRVGDARDRQVDIQLIAASHQDLARAMAISRFRSDLFYRICTIPLRIPALRDRKEDIPHLARELLGRLAADLCRPPVGLEPDALTALQSYAWPGNVRELRNVLERAVLLTDRSVLRRQDLAFDTPPGPGQNDGDGLTLKEAERRHIQRTLEAAQGRVEEAARRLGIPRSTMYLKIKQFGITAN